MKDHPIIVSGDDDTFVQSAKDFMEREIVTAIEKTGRAVIGLSGGSTPRPVYELLGKSRLIDWSKVWIFLVDDRYIRADDPKSNQFLIRSTLLKNAPIPESQIIFPDVSLPIRDCIDLYAKHLTSVFKKGPADIVTLGMGDDGHIASLFPPLSDLALSDEALVIPTATERFDVRDRISVSLKVLTDAKSQMFLLSGSSKQKTWKEMTESEEDARRWPAKAVLKTGASTIFARW